jgi:O-antigen ligase
VNGVAANKPVYALAITWLLLVPLLFFVARGTFSLDRPQSGEFTASEEDAMNTTGTGSAYFQLQQVAMYAIVVAAMVPLLDKLRKPVRENLLVFSLPAWALVSALWSQSLVKTIPFGVFTLLLSLFGVYLSQRFTPKRQIELFLFVGWVAIILSVLAAAFYPAAGLALSYGTKAWRGIWVQKNHCGMVATLLAYGAFCVTPKNSLQRLTLFLFGFMATALVVFSQSRTAWIIFAMSLFFIALMNALKRVRVTERLFFVLTLCIVIGGISALAVLYSAQIAVALGKDPTLSGRTEIWTAIAPELWKRPLQGFGYRAFWLGMKGESGTLSLALGGTTPLTNSENSILELWLELGIIGAGLALVTIFQACRNALTCFRQDMPKHIQWYILIVFYNVLSLGDGDKIMFPHTVEWLLFVVAYVGLSAEARRIRGRVTA